MIKVLRQTTLETLGLGTVLDIFRRGRRPVEAAEAVGRVFGEPGRRGALVISGVNGIVGAGKAMQLGSRLLPHGVPLAGIDLPGAPDGLAARYPGLVAAFGTEGASAIMGNIIRLSYDGRSLPAELGRLRPALLLEAIPEVLQLKRDHYAIFREAFGGIEIRSVTSGFPMRELGVGIAHPAFPHEINKVWEVVEPETSDVTRMLWSLGMIPIPVSDDWSFVLDVLFCGVTLAALRYHRARNMPFWKIDKFVRRLLGPNPFRAHDAIGAAGANFLTWSCLHHLGEVYGPLFKPTPELDERRESGVAWYPPNHFRPLVDWKLDPAGEQDFQTWILGPLFQMASLVLHEKRAHPAHVNAIGELCAQFRTGILAFMRARGAESVIATVEAYHRLDPAAAGQAWHPHVFEAMGSTAWQQLYVNAEHDGEVGVVTISRESYNDDVDRELNRALDWLKAEGIDRMILTGDFHLATQMVGADTSDFFPALEREEEGRRVSGGWSRTARRLDGQFKTSVAFINGKRCLGGMLELLTHCHYLIAVEDAQLGMPEVTVPVVPGMEGCHWPFRKAGPGDWPKLVRLLLTGRPMKAADAVGWLVDFAGPMDEALATAWQVACGGDHRLKRRPVERGALPGMPAGVGDQVEPDGAAIEAARKAIMDCIRASHGASADDALDVQTRHSAGFMLSNACRGGRVGVEYRKTMKI